MKEILERAERDIYIWVVEQDDSDYYREEII